MKKENIVAFSLVQYGFFALPLAFAGFPIYVLAPDFYATEYGITLSSLGTILLLLRLFDAIQDPLIGIISDRYRSKILFIMVPSAFILVISIYSLFTLSFFSPLIWFIICMSLSVTAYSVLSINMNALGALWTEETNTQTLIIATREAFGLFGLVLAVSLPSLLSKVVPKNQLYQWFGLLLAILMAAALLVFLRWYNFGAPKLNKKMTPSSFSECIKTLCVDSKKLFLVCLLSTISSSIPAVLVIFFVRDLLGAENYTGIFLLIYFLSGVCFMPFWKVISKRYGKYRSWFFAMLLASISFIWAFFLKKGDIWQYAFICSVSGSSLSADLIFPPSILADHLHAAESESSASTYYGLLTLIVKVSLAFAAALSFPILESFSFIPDAYNSDGALIGLSLSYALIPCIIKFIAAFLLWHIFIHTKKGIVYENN